MAEDARKWVVEGLCDARSLPEALAERRFPLVLHHLEKLDQRRNWLLDMAEWVLREDEQMRLSERDAHWLEDLIRQKNRDEGDIRFCAIDLYWRRLCIETCIHAGDLEDARIALKAYFTSDTSDRRKIYKLHPDGLQHLLAFANAYDAYISKAATAQKKGKKAPRWPFKGLPNDGRIDAELLVKMTKDWSLCARPYLMRPEAQQSLPASTSQSHSQDSLPTPGPSSDGFGAATTSARPVEDRASPRKRRRTESPDGGERRVQMEAEAVEMMQVEVVVQAEEAAVGMDVEVEAVKTPEPPEIAVDAGSSPAPATPPPVVPAKQQPPPVSPRRSPRLSPSLPPTPERRPGSPAPSPRRSPRPRARSPTFLAAPSAFLALPSLNDEADSLPESQLPPTKPFPIDIFSLLAKGAAEQDQKLRSSRRLSEPAPPAEPTPPPQQTAPSDLQPAEVEKAEKSQAKEPAQQLRPTPPPATPLGPSASTVLMPPPPATSKSKRSTQSPAANVSTSAPAPASSQDSSSAQPSTLPSDISAAADLSSESQSQSLSTGDPLPGRPATERSGIVPPLTGFTASTTASPADVSMDAPTPAQGATQLVPDTPESSAPLAKAVVAETVEAAVSVTLVSQSTQSTSSGSGTSNHVSDSQASNGEQSGRTAVIISSLETASSSQPNPFTQPLVSTRPFTRGNSVQPIVNVLSTAQAQAAATGSGSNSSQQSSFGSDTSGLTYLSHTEMERIQEEALAAQRAKEAEAEERRKREEREAAEEARRQAEREMLESQQDEASQGILGTDEDDDMSATASPADVSVEQAEAGVDMMDVDEMDDDMPLSQAPLTQVDVGDGTTPEDGSPVKGRPRRRSFIEVESEAEDDDAPDVDDEAGGFLEFVNLDGNE
ncbi:hypothetical protein NBRC10513v2_000577 [Rhodotorula toruloides]